MTAVIDRQDCGGHNTRQGSTESWTYLYPASVQEMLCSQSRGKCHPLPCQFDEPPGHSGTPHSRTPRPSAGPDSRALLYTPRSPSPRRVRTPHCHHRAAAGQIDSFFAEPPSSALLFGSKVRVPLEDPIRTRVARGGAKSCPLPPHSLLVLVHTGSSYNIIRGFFITYFLYENLTIVNPDQVLQQDTPVRFAYSQLFTGRIYSVYPYHLFT